MNEKTPSPRVLSLRFTNTRWVVQSTACSYVTLRRFVLFLQLNADVVPKTAGNQSQFHIIRFHIEVLRVFPFYAIYLTAVVTLQMTLFQTFPLQWKKTWKCTPKSVDFELEFSCQTEAGSVPLWVEKSPLLLKINKLFKNPLGVAR